MILSIVLALAMEQQPLKCPKGQHPELLATLSTQDPVSHGGEKCVLDKPEHPTQGTAANVPLCGKYQHVEHWPDGQCGPPNCSGNICTAACAPPPPDKCVDDMHEVTEREWEEMQQKIKSLQEALRMYILNHAAH